MYKNSLSYRLKICTLYVCYLHLNFLKWNLKKIHNAERKNKLEILHQNTSRFNKSERQSHFEKYIKISFHPRFSFLKLKLKSLSRVQLFVTLCTIAYEAPPSMEFFFFNIPRIIVCVCQWLRHIQLFATPWTIVHQAPLSMGFSRQEYWVFLGFPFLLQGIFPTKGLNLDLLHCRQVLYHLSHQGSPKVSGLNNHSDSHCIFLQLPLTAPGLHSSFLLCAVLSLSVMSDSLRPHGL